MIMPVAFCHIQRPFNSCFLQIEITSYDGIHLVDFEIRGQQMKVNFWGSLVNFTEKVGSFLWLKTFSYTSEKNRNVEKKDIDENN